MGKVRLEIIYFVTAAVFLFLAVPLMPSSLLLKPRAIVVDAENIMFTRDVVVPVHAHWTVEFERMSPPPPIRRVDCDQSGEAHFEKRNGVPVTFAHDCDFNGTVAAEWQVRMCWEVAVTILHMRPVCMTKTFFPHAAEMGELGEQLEALRLELNVLKEAQP